MCTLTVIQTPSGWRLVHSRDEQRTRSPAAAPLWRALPSGRRAVWPTDPDAGGTWIAARDDALTLALLNRNIPPNGRRPPARSRGLLIPALIDLEGPGAVMLALAGADLAPLAPFRLVALDACGPALLATWDGLTLPDPEPLQPPFCLVSSGLGDARVADRLLLFDGTVGADPTPDAQDAFHRHRWDDRPEVSVLMSRADARTVSITTVSTAPGDAPEVSVQTLPESAPWCDPVGAALLK